MTSRLEGTVALVTGASSGIGEATALALAAQGADGRCRSPAPWTGWRRWPARSGPTAARCWCSRPTSPSTTRPSAWSSRPWPSLGRLDTLVNNAGLMLLGPTVGADTGEWSRMVEINLNALLWCAHAALPHLLSAAEQGPRGRVADLVNISSVAGRFPRSGSAAYNATKHAVTGFSEALRQEVTQRHVRVSMVEPGAVAYRAADCTTQPRCRPAWTQRFGDTELLEPAGHRRGRRVHRDPAAAHGGQRDADHGRRSRSDLAHVHERPALVLLGVRRDIAVPLVQPDVVRAVGAGEQACTAAASAAISAAVSSRLPRPWPCRSVATESRLMWHTPST